MTVQEASKTCFGKPYVVDIEEHKEAIKTIKEALAELEQYRAIGSTPTQILERIGGLDVKLGKYACIGTVEEVTNQKHNLSVAYKVIEELQQKDWIPCEERLPEGKETDKVLVTDKDGIMAVCYFLEVTKIFKVRWNGDEFQGAFAWQPLPQPYKKDYSGEVTEMVTNADRIRNMTDEELAKIIGDDPHCEKTECEDSCHECTLKWLQAEVKEGNSNENP